MSKQLSAHFEKVEPVEAVNLINADPNTEWVLIVNPPTHNHFPGKNVVGRLQLDNEEWFVDRGAWGAEEWWRIHGPSLLMCTYITWWVSCNEPAGSYANTGPYVLRWTQIAHSHGKKVIAFNFAVGDFPAGDKEEDQENINELLSAIELADAMGFHAYWVPEHWNPEYVWAESMLIWRYKEFMKLLPSEYQSKPIFITECGCDGGVGDTIPGRENTDKGWLGYYSCEQDYLDHLWKFQAGLDERVVAAFVFDVGAWPRWLSFNLTLSLIRGIMKYNTILEPIPSPVPPEGGVEMERPIRVMCSDGIIREMELETYLYGVVPCEVYPNWPDAVLDAQAICARSFAVAAIKSSKHYYQDYHVCSKQCCQVFDSSRATPTTNAAVSRTEGIVGVVDGEVAKMFFSACCGGSTLDHWAPSYLRIVGCPCGQHKDERTQAGHRQGMCQWGAYYCVEDWNFTTWKEILDHYFNLEYHYDYGQGELVFPNGEEEPTNGLEEKVNELEEWLGVCGNELLALKAQVNTIESVVSDAVRSIIALEKWAMELSYKEGV